MTHLRRQLDRLVRNSWLSAALDGRFSGSGAVFANQDPVERFKVDADRILQNARTDAVDSAEAIGADVVQRAVGAASPGAVIVTRDMMVLAAVAVAVGYVLYKSND